MKSGDLLKLEEMDARVVPNATALPPSFVGLFGPTSSFSVSAFPAATSALSSTGGFASSIVSISPEIGSGVLSAPFASSILPPHGSHSSSTLPVGAGFFPITPTPTDTFPITSVPTPTIHQVSPPPPPNTNGTHSSPHALAGSGHGTFTHPITPGDITIAELTTYQFHGTANLAKMGKVTVTGTIHSVGFVVSGKATGTLTFTNSKGSVTIQLTGPQQGGFSPLPGTFSYKVVSHTGTAYKSLTDHGTLTLTVPSTTSGFQVSGSGNFTFSIP